MSPSNGFRKSHINAIKALIKDGEPIQAHNMLRTLASLADDFPTLHKYSKIWKSIPKDSLGLSPIRISVVGTSTTNYLVEICELWLGLQGFDADIYQAEFGTLDQELLNPASGTYKHQPDIIWLYSNYRDAVPQGAACASTNQHAAVDDAFSRFSTLWKVIADNSGACIVQNNADLPPDRLWGNYEATLPWGRLSQLREFNTKLAKQLPSEAVLLDMDHLSSLFGKKKWSDERYWYSMRSAVCFDALGLIGHQFSRIVAGIKGKSKKCLVLDLDNTLWGGVIGDDGLEGIKIGGTAEGEAFQDFQRYIKGLKSRGIVLTVCSKNQEDIAKSPFEQHPDMILKLEDIAVFVANWENKADNIRYIAQTLNIGLDSLVFIDDNPAERKLVQSLLPEVATPDLPEEPAYYLKALDGYGYFETIAFSCEDRSRADMYRANAKRTEAQKQYANLDDFLKGLRMVGAVKTLDSMTLPRFAQLINKSNQFHLTTTRYAETELMKMNRDDDWICRCFCLADAFGNHGLVALYLGRKEGVSLRIDTFVMSCRVLSRGLEQFVHNDMLVMATANGCDKIIGVYKPTAKNGLVKELYRELGYSLTEEKIDGSTHWELSDPNAREHFVPFIKKVDWNEI